MWKALADPTRRTILDRLRKAPQTTGSLAAGFPGLTRFAVMKHLNILVEAKLVLVVRQGRERWNFLNAARLHELYDRWLAPYEAEWAARLGRLRSAVGTQSFPGKGGTLMAEDRIRIVRMEQEVDIEAPARKVFEALTGDLSAWWGPPYRFAPEREGRMLLEPHAGGRFVETWGEEGEGLWAVVTEIRRDERLELTGRLGMPEAFEGVIRFSLEEAPGNRTTLRVSHRAIGEITDETERAYSSGWADLVGRLKRTVETGPVRVRGAER